MPRKKVKINRLLAALLAAALFIAMLAALPSDSAAEAAASLPYIEKLRTQLIADVGRMFRVLEITAPSARGTIGFYMADSESGSLLASTALPSEIGSAARTSYAELHLNSIKGSMTGVYGSNQDSYPFDIQGYQEGYYWASAAEYPNVLALDHTETAADIMGSITPVTDGSGEYQTEYTYAISPGDFILSGGYFKHVTSAPADTCTHYFYNSPAFAALEHNNDNFPGTSIPVPDGTAIYVKNEITGFFDFLTYKAPGALNPFLDDADLDTPTYNYGEFYVVQAVGTPNSSAYSSPAYELVDASVTVVPTGGGYLSRTLKHLTLVGSDGDCNFTAGSGTAHTIHYSKVRYSGGFVNHNWFSRFVLDADTADIPQIKYTVDTKASDALGTVIPAAYDLIVVGSGVVASALPANVISAIKASDDTIPALFLSPDISVLSEFNVTGLNTSHNGNFVSDGMYFYTPTSDTAPGYSDFVTTKFRDDFRGTSAASGFSAVLADINNENDLRAITDAERLPVSLSLATSVRYILNRRDPHVVIPLTQVRILEIQPYHNAGIDAPSATTRSAKYLINSTTSDNAENPLNVHAWLKDLKIVGSDGVMRDIVPNDIHITTMSTKEFNGKIEDLNESYELIYIGASLSHFSGDTASAFTDTTMNGLLYSNVGDLYTSSTNTLSAGLLNSDWVGNTPNTYIRSGNLPIRLSGNDISLKKRQVLEDFVGVGYPVVFADDLLTYVPIDGSAEVVSAYTPNTSRVDSRTHLYEFMLSALRKGNSFNNKDLAGSASAISVRQASLRSYVSLSKPSIIFETIDGFPTAYSITGSTMTHNAYGSQLNYRFSISDPADPTPASTTYNIRLYIDSNAGGIYTADESVNVDIYTSDNRLVVPSMSGGEAVYSLEADVKYHLQTKLPNYMVGIIPWKLEIVKNPVGGNNTSYFRGSQIGYTRIEPTDGHKTVINVLQLISSSDSRTVVLQENAAYSTYINVADFDIKLNSILANGAVYNTALKPSTLGSRSRLWAADASVDTIYNELIQYDMLVIGFADCYGELTDNAANAVLKYIETGRAVLFTHDTTSFINVPAGTRVNSSGGVDSYNGKTHWGYSFNKILRSAVGLDYYGISDPAFSFLKTSTDDLTVEQIDRLKTAGYNIAYTPKSSGATDYMTQGFTDYHIKSGVENLTTTNVSQINSGQITTYPYNINLRGFQGAPSGAADTLSVMNTHQQYYSLNMNRDDLVVWYALDGDSYSYNDASDGYYIYTMGNITYSGVGHTDGNSTDEAKLFINTMIAAYRSHGIAPEVTVRDKNNIETDFVYFTSDVSGTSVSVSNNATDEMFAAYFSFIDANIMGGTTGVSTAKFYYSTGSADVYKTAAMLPIADSAQKSYSGTGTGRLVSSVVRSTLYHFYIPPEIVRLLNTNESVRIYIEITTTFNNGENCVGYDSLELRKIGLLALK